MIGVLHGCTLDVVPGSLWRAEADLAVAGIHLRDPAPTLLLGLEQALGGGFDGLRGAGLLSGGLGETLLLSRPPAPIRAKAVLILGLGGSEAVTAETVRRAARTAAGQATQMRVGHVTSACGDADGAGTAESALPHLWAAIAGIESVLRAGRQIPQRWSFLSDPAELEPFARRFRSAFDRAIASGPSTR